MGKIKIGIFGVGRGSEVIKDFLMNNCDIVAICESRKERLESANERLKVINPVIYDDFDEFLNHGFDAVFIANYFHEHAKYAIKCLEKGIHVLSECLSNGTMAEGVELIRAAEKSNAIYMIGENYPHRLANREIKKMCDSKVLGKIIYAEGEYNHPFSPEGSENKIYCFFEEHWRHYTPRTYYVTHSLGPIMHITGATPVKVISLASFAPATDNYACANMQGDAAAIMITQNDDGSVFKFTGCSNFAGCYDYTRVCGQEGQIESTKGAHQVTLRFNQWSIPEGMERLSTYTPQWNDKDEELIKKSGHGGADYIMVRTFLDCIKQGKQPEHPFDVYSAVTMSSVAILGHRSMLEGGKPYDIPDFKKEEARKQYENDRLSPYYGSDGTKPTIQCCSHADYAPTEEQRKAYHKSLE